jgi:hypothetical protein
MPEFGSFDSTSMRLRFAGRNSSCSMLMMASLLLVLLSLAELLVLLVLLVLLLVLLVLQFCSSAAERATCFQTLPLTAHAAPGPCEKAL